MKNIFLALPLLVLTSCYKSSASLSKLPDQGVILAFGDSLTYGTGASARNDYPSLLGQRTPHKVVNAGRPVKSAKTALNGYLPCSIATSPI